MYERSNSQGKISGNLAACGIFALLIPLGIQLGLTTWTGVVLFDREVGVSCEIDGKDVASSFQTVLLLFFISQCGGIFTQFIGLINNALKGLFGCGFSCLSLVVYIWMHVARLSHGGRVCSGAGEVSEFSSEEQTQWGALSSRGSYLMGWLIVSWVLFGLVCFCGVCAVVLSLLKSRM